MLPHTTATSSITNITPLGMLSAFPMNLAFPQYLKGEVIPSLTTLAKEVGKWDAWVQLLVLLYSVIPRI